MNLLILSCGTRNKVVCYARKAFAGKGLVIGADCSKYAPALYDADKFYLIPRITDAGWLDAVLDICRKEKVSGILSLIDLELSMLADARDCFEQLGVTVIGSGTKQCELALDKWKMYLWLKEHGYRCASSFMDTESFSDSLKRGEITYPVFVKPARGSASIGIGRASDDSEVSFLMSRGEGMMIQEFLHGTEIGCDCYVDLITGEVAGIFTKKKLVMRAGETDKGISFTDPALFELIKKFLVEAGFRGPVDIDVFECDGEYYISEVNPRFGGGYPHAYECGCDWMSKIVNNLAEIPNKPEIGGYENDVVMMKYCDVKVMKL